MIPAAIVYLLIVGSLVLTTVGAVVLLILLFKDQSSKTIW